MKFLLYLLLFSSFTLTAEEIVTRPIKWAQPILNTKLKNFHKLDQKLYRSAQPNADDFKTLEKMGFKTIINLRHYHSDTKKAQGTKLKLIRFKFNAKKLTYKNMVKVMKIIKKSKGPILIHCWHGSDRTGTVCAFYRMTFQNWSKKEALEELKKGHFGFHKVFKNIPELFKKLNTKKLQKDVGVK